MAIKAVFFDMNGIVIDDEHIHEMAFRETLKPFGINLTHKEYLECCVGKTDKDGYRSIADDYSIKIDINNIIKEKETRYFNLFPKNKKTYLGVINLIKKFSEEFVLALVSSSSRAEVDLVVQELKIKDYFKFTISADEVKKGKPDPEPYLLAANILGLQTKECAVIEDSTNGVVSAKAAGCYCIGVSTTHEREMLKDADLIVDRFSEINGKVVLGLEK
jgi:HAD superfamily hydrolase (TIGR01509 family)